MTVTWTEILLRKLRVRLNGAVSPYVLRNARAHVEMDRVSDRMVATLDSHVLGQEETATHRIVEAPIYLTWKHHLVASLPEGSFRRRYLTNFFLLEGQSLAHRRVHEVTAYARAAFPAAEVQMPPEYGDVVRLAAIDDRAYWENP